MSTLYLKSEDLWECCEASVENCQFNWSHDVNDGYAHKYIFLLVFMCLCSLLTEHTFVIYFYIFNGPILYWCGLMCLPAMHARTYMHCSYCIVIHFAGVRNVYKICLTRVGICGRSCLSAHRNFIVLQVVKIQSNWNTLKFPSVQKPPRAHYDILYTVYSVWYTQHLRYDIHGVHCMICTVFTV